MTSAPPLLVVLLGSSLAAAAAALGPLPLMRRSSAPRVLIGWANALAAGMMLGAAYVVVAGAGGEAGLAAGAALGILFIYATHAGLGTTELDLNRLDDPEAAYAFRISLVGALHAASEGIAIGAATAVDTSLGIFTMAAIAAHNIPEATVLTAVLRRRLGSLHRAAVLAVVVNVPQILLAVVTFALAETAPSTLPWARGFAMGALVNLVMVELLPEAYREAGHTSIAVGVAVALGIVVLLLGSLP